MRKKKRFALFSLLLVGLFGIGTASAFLINEAVGGSHSETIDGAIILKWGTDKALDAVTDLVPTSPVYRRVSLEAPQKAGTVTDTPTFSVSLVPGLAQENKYVSLRGIKVEFATSTWLVGAGESAPTPVLTLDWSTGTWLEGAPGAAGVVDTDGNPEAQSTAITGTDPVLYYIKISISEEAFAKYAGDNNYLLNGKLALSYKLVAA